MVSAIILTRLLFVFSSLIKCTFTESTFLNSLHEVINFNSDCHITLLLHQTFAHDIEIQSPVSIRSYTSFRDETSRLPVKSNPPISVTRIRGIYCIYAIIVHILSETPKSQMSYQSVSQNFTRDSVYTGNYSVEETSTIFQLGKRFFEIQLQQQRIAFLINRMTTLILLTDVQLSFLQKIEEDFIYYHKYFKKFGIVLFSPSDLKVTNKPFKKFIENYVCYNCAESPPFLQSKVKFGLQHLSRFDNYLAKVNDKHLILDEQKQSWKHFLFENTRSQPNTYRVISPMHAAKNIEKVLQASKTMRKYLDLIMLFTIIEARNSTVQYCEYETLVGYNYESCPLVHMREIIITSEISTYFLEKAYTVLRNPVLLLEDTTHSFVTCYSKPVLSIRFYISPFQGSLWVVFIVSAIFMWRFWITIYKDKCSERKTSYSVFLFLISTLTDDSCGLPAWFSKKLSFRVTFTAWFLATVVLVNGYIGCLISGITSEFEEESVHSFRDLSVQYYTYDTITKLLLWRTMGDGRDEKCCSPSRKPSWPLSNFPCFKPREFDEEKDFRLLSSAKKETGVFFNIYDCNETTIQWHISSFSQRMHEFNYETIKHQHNKELIEEAHKMPTTSETILRIREEWMFNLIYPSHNGFPAEALHLVVFDTKTGQCVLEDINAFANIIEKELVKCGRTVFVDEHNKVLLEYKYLKKKYPKLKFFISENVWPLKRMWQFLSKISDPSLYRGIKTLISSGIYYRALEYFESRKFLERNNAQEKSRTLISSSNDPNLLKLTGRIVTLFILFLLSLVITALVFFSERVISRFLASTYLMTRGMNTQNVLELYKTLPELFLREVKIQKVLYQLSMQLYPRNKA